MLGTQIKSRIRGTVAWMYHASNHFLKRLQGRVLILMYHRVLPAQELGENLVQPGMYVSQDVFEKQIQFIEEHFHVISFAELLRLWKNKTYDPTRRYCVITFDDGWLDNYVYAYPILKKCHIPATIFLPTAFVGTNRWFWPDQVSFLLRFYYSLGVNQEIKQSLTSLCGRYPWMNKIVFLPDTIIKPKRLIDRIDAAIETFKALPEEDIHEVIKTMSELLCLKIPDNRIILNWKEIDEMSRHGVSFGSHSCTHKMLTKLPIAESRKEISDSLLTLREKKINSVPVFCYPNGDFNQQVVSEVKAAGYQAAVSSYFGHEGLFPEELFCLKRIGVHNDISATLPLFTFHISALSRFSKINGLSQYNI